MRLQLVRNATLRLDYGGRTLLVDPFLAPRHSLPSFGGNGPNPTANLPMPEEEVLADVDLVVVSHLHPDHFDARAQELLRRDTPLLCQPTDEAAIRALGFEKVQGVEDTVTWGGLTLHRTPGEHGSGAILARMGPVSGFVLRAEGEPTVYWAGDTVLYSGVRETLERVQPDVIVTHSGGATLSGTLIIMDAEQTLEVCRLCPAATVVATHLEALDHCAVTREALRTAADEAGISRERLRIPADGGALTL